MFKNLAITAKAIAKERRHIRFRCCHVAFILRNSRIVTIAPNEPCSHPKNLRYKYAKEKTGLCAELNAVIKSKLDNYSKHKIVVARVDRNGNLNNSRPCLGCQQVIEQLNFKECWYTNKNGEFVKY